MDFCELWNLEYDKLELYYDVKERRVVFPVKKDGLIVDAVGRSVGLNFCPNGNDMEIVTCLFIWMW